MRSRNPDQKGLVAYVGHQVVELLTEQQLFDNAMSVLPQLRSVTTRPHFHGPHWTALRPKHGVELFEFDPTAHVRTRAPSSATDSMPSPFPSPYPSPFPSPAIGATPTVATSRSSRGMMRRGSSTTSLPHGFQTQLKLPNPGTDMGYAIVAQCELDCHMSEVLDALFSDEPSELEASLNALWGNQLKRGDLLLSREVHRPQPSARGPTPRHARPTDPDTTPKDVGRLTIKTAALTSRIGAMHWPKKFCRGENLCFTTYTQRSSSKNEAFHVVKTLPRDVHDQIACGRSHAALSDPNVDHIAVGYHLTGISSPLTGHRTKLVLCAYVSTYPTPEQARSSLLSWHRDGVVGGPARSVVKLLARAARGFQRVIRRRRFGHQTFIYFPATTSTTNKALEMTCVVCHKRFGMLRKDHYCQLCGHLVCRKCSQKHEVETAAGKVRENRLCFPCVARVDSCVLEEEGLWKSLRRPLIVDQEVISPGDAFEAIEETEEDENASILIAHQLLANEDDEANDEEELSRSQFFVGALPKLETPRAELQVAEDLFSPNPQRRANALEALTRAVIATTIASNITSRPSSVSPTQLIASKYLRQQSQEEEEEEGKPSVLITDDDDDDGGSLRLSQLDRSSLVHLSGQLDGRAFDSISEVAAKRMQCSMAYVAMMEGSEQCIVGSYDVPESTYRLPRRQSITLSGLTSPEAPYVVTNPMQDKRFRHMRFVHEAQIRFLAYFPVKARDGSVIAALCTADTQSREAITQDDYAAMQTLCMLVADVVDAGRGPQRQVA
ncbi:hypothetical protein Poli38472_006505 [Pythium oligandrum]|uniref:FYVE-type domain-containing protein n=1 Tax=Pythium oligandrum TaxID=41045 RepID=A0A8K1C511_PYTOL|nr:hypothetical protein Poli38472_006505 [Pythium oligandrum]|eukprot:TMW56495.1 hypothetical protein Poli38472_006505 [Pythium oligandrum]